MSTAQVVLTLLGGGVLASIASLITARSMARKTQVEADQLEDEGPAKIDSVIAQGSETAVLAMDRVLQATVAQLDRAHDRIAHLEEQRAEDHKTIGELQDQLREMQLKVEHAEQATADARKTGLRLAERLDLMAASHQTRELGGQ